MNYLLTPILLKLTLFMICYLLIVLRKNLSLIDVFWGISFLPASLVFLLRNGIENTHATYLAIAIILWALRLSFYLSLRLKKKKRDQRYEKMCEGWKNFYLESFYKVVLVQAVISYLLSIGIYIGLNPLINKAFGAHTVLCIIIFVMGLTIQGFADSQMSRFKIENKTEKTFTGGLWRYVRYPNYLGEILIWLSFGFWALPANYGLSLFSPILITFFLIKVSGIPYLEKRRASREAYPYKRPKYFLFPGIY